jgi:hypothetical protein
MPIKTIYQYQLLSSLLGRVAHENVKPNYTFWPSGQDLLSVLAGGGGVEALGSGGV